MAGFLSFLQKRGLGIGVEILVNFLGPYLIYSYARTIYGDVGALLASTAPPLLWSVVTLVRERRLDAISLLVLFGIGLSLLAFLGSGSVKMLQLRDKLITLTIGLIFLGSALIGRPLIYYLARAGMRRGGNQAQADYLEERRDNADMRHSMTVMTVVWGVGLVLEASVAALLVFKLSISQFLLVSPTLGYSVIGGLILWTIWYVRHQRSRASRRAAAEGSATLSG